MALTQAQRDASMADDQMLAIENALKSGKLTYEKLPLMIVAVTAGRGKNLTEGARQIVIKRLEAMLQGPDPATECKYCAQPSLETGEFCQVHQDIRDAMAAKAAQIAEQAVQYSANRKMGLDSFKPQASGDIDTALAMRKAGAWLPDGAVDASGYWYPSESEECPECAHVKSPWATQKDKYRIHCNSEAHLRAAMLCGDEWM